MEVYLIRHTTPEVEKGTCYGQSNIPLTDTFIEEVKIIKSKLPYLDDSYTFYSSPLDRCKLLSEELTTQNIHFDDRLMELNFGDWELQKWTDIKKEELDPWMKDFVHTKTKNGESYVDLNNRVLDFFKSVSYNKKIVLVTHGGIIRSILASHNKTLLEKSFDFKIDYGAVIYLKSCNFFENSSSNKSNLIK